MSTDSVKSRQMLFALQTALRTFVEEYTRATGLDEISDKELLAAGVGFKTLVDMTIEENTRNMTKLVKEGTLRQPTKEYVNITPQRPTITPTGNDYHGKGGNARRHQ